MRILKFSYVLTIGLTMAAQLVQASGITDIKITACAALDDCAVIPGYRRIREDLNRLTANSNFVHLHFTDNIDIGPKGLPITDISVEVGDNKPDLTDGWVPLEGNLNDGTRGPVLTMYVKRDPTQSPLESLVVKYGPDSYAALGFDRLSVDLNQGTGGQWVYLFYKREGDRPDITQIATQACMFSVCNLDDSWTRVNRPIIVGGFRRYLYLFYKSVPGEQPITDLQLGYLDQDGYESIDTGVSSVKISFKRGNIGDEHAVDNIAVEIGNNPTPFGWKAADFVTGDKEAPAWGAQVLYRNGAVKIPAAPRLRFHRDGSFKIVQFADIHMATGPHMCFNVPSDQKCIGDVDTIDMMEKVLDVERPDLVLFSGDNVNGMTSGDALSTILKYSTPVMDRQIPWAIIFGNHDEEGDLTREEMMQAVCDLPYSLSERGPLDISGVGNYILKIYKAKENDQVEDETEELHKFTIYLLDSGAYSFDLKHPGYDWIKHDQVDWFRQESRAITSKFAKDSIPNALAVFHIPLPEYAMVDEENDGEDNGGNEPDERTHKDVDESEPRLVGGKREGVSSPGYNSGFFEAVLESKDVAITTVGHDHLNDYCLNHKGIKLCYGGALGYGSYGSASVARRSRVFQLNRNGDRIYSWKRLHDADLTVVDDQLLIDGKKLDNVEPASPSRSSSRPVPAGHRGQALWRQMRQGGQFAFDAIRG